MKPESAEKILDKKIKIMYFANIFIFRY